MPAFFSWSSLLKRVQTIRINLLLLVVVIMLPTVAMWAWYIQNESNEQRQAAYAQVQLLVDDVTNSARNEMDDHAQVLQLIGQEYLREMGSSDRTFNPDQFMRLHPSVVEIGVRDAAGNNIYSSRTPAQSSADLLAAPWAESARLSDTPSVSGALLDAHSGRWVTVMTQPVYSATGKRTGFSYLSIDLLKMNQRLLSHLNPNWVIPVFDRDDRFLMRSIDPNVWIGKPLPKPNADLIRGKVREVFTAPDIHGVMRLYALATLPSLGWRVAVGIPETQALAGVDAKRNTSILLGLGTLLSLMALAWWRASSIADPILALAQGVEKMQDNSQHRIALRGPVELEQVAAKLNAYVDRIEQQHKERMALAQHYATMRMQAREIILLFDESGHILDANEAALAAYGYSEVELYEMSERNLRAASATPASEPDLNAPLQSQGNVLLETVHCRKDGSTFDVEVSSSSIDIAGKVYRQSFVRDISERRKAQRRLADSEQFAKATIDAVSAHICVIGSAGVILAVNRAWADFAELNQPTHHGRGHDVGTNYLAICDAATGPGSEEASPIAQGIRCVARKECAEFTLEYPCHSATEKRWFVARVTPFHGDSGNLVIAHENVTQRKLTELALQGRTRALEALSACNRALASAASLDELTQEVCRAMVNHAGYRMAWVGAAQSDAEKSIKVWANAGSNDGYLEHLHVNWADTPQGRGPSGTAIREGKIALALNLGTDPNFAPWRESAAQHGFAAAAALPLLVHGVAWGALIVYTATLEAFDADEILLLEELSNDLAYGIGKFLDADIRHDLEQTLAASEDRFRLLIEESPAGIFAMRHGVFVYANPRMEQIMGFAADELVGMHSQQLIVPEDWHLITEAMERLTMKARTGNFAVRARRKDGSVIELGLQDVLTQFEGQPAIIGMAQDISERSRAQAQINSYIAQLEHTTEATLQSVALMVEKRDPYTAGHERRVGELAAAIGTEMGLSDHVVKGLRLTGIVHDIGKIAVPAELLAKPTRLSEVEMALIRVHPQAGYDVLKNVEFPWPLAEVILQHHERLDGSGYPRGLKADAILLESRIMMVADVVESMSSHRPYRPGLGIDAALGEIEKHRSTFYDPAVVDACTRLYREKGYVLPA